MCSDFFVVGLISEAHLEVWITTHLLADRGEDYFTVGWERGRRGGTCVDNSLVLLITVYCFLGHIVGTHVVFLANVVADIDQELGHVGLRVRVPSLRLRDKFVSVGAKNGVKQGVGSSVSVFRVEHQVHRR